METKLNEPKFFKERICMLQNELFVEKTGENSFFKGADKKPSRYFKLDEILQAVRPLLLKHRLLITQAIREDKLVTSIMDMDSSDFEYSSVTIPQAPDVQKFVASVTYLKRASLLSLLLIEERDDDGNEATGKDPQEAGAPDYDPKAKQAPAAASGFITPEQAKELYKFAYATKKFTFSEVDQRVRKGFNCSVDSLTPVQLEQIYRSLKGLS